MSFFHPINVKDAFNWKKLFKKEFDWMKNGTKKKKT